ncbi:SpoIIE family protein phosphatase, partial [Streptomyces sp. SID1328]|uniref:SpoIIE family protein phosphatase n=1 Tax=Streptomyces sp. SID1328 TaxID=2690250 RepID=UPI00136B0A88
LLALYTDGLVETRYDAIDIGLHALCRTLENATGSLQQTCDSLLDTVDRTSADDVALLLARFGGA